MPTRADFNNFPRRQHDQNAERIKELKAERKMLLQLQRKSSLTDMFFFFMSRLGTGMPIALNLLGPQFGTPAYNYNKERIEAIDRELHTLENPRHSSGCRR